MAAPDNLSALHQALPQTAKGTAAKGKPQMAAATAASKKGTVESDKTYYPKDVLGVAYRKLKDAQLGIFAEMLP